MYIYIMKAKKSIQAFNQLINAKNRKLGIKGKLIKIVKALNIPFTKIIFKECNIPFPSISDGPYHIITIYLDITKFKREEFAKKLGLSKYHIHVNEQVITKKGPINIAWHKAYTGQTSKHSSINISI
jgi:hypothetical protein